MMGAGCSRTISMPTHRNSPTAPRHPSREALAALVHAWVEDMLERPLETVVAPARLAPALAHALRQAAADQRNRELLRAQLTGSLQDLEAPGLKGRPPKRAITAARRLVSQPVVPGRELVTALLDHEAPHVLLREVLQRSFAGFAHQVASLLPGGELAFWLLGQARDIAASAAGEVASDLEARVNAGVDEALAPALDHLAERMTDAQFARQLADWRGHVVQVLFDRPISQLVAGLDDTDPRALATALVDLLHGLAEWPQLEGALEAWLTAALRQSGSSSLRELLTGTSLEQDWRQTIEAQLVEAIWPFLQSPAFAQWVAAFAPGPANRRRT